MADSRKMRKLDSTLKTTPSLPAQATRETATQEHPPRLTKEMEAYERQMPEIEPNPVFNTFKTSADLGEGLCVVRSLGRGKFVLVNLDKFTEAAISSEEAVKAIAAVPGLKKVLKGVRNQWKSSGFKVQQAIKAADGTVFRFCKLPTELRWEIYELCLTSNNTLSRRGISHKGSSDSFFNVALLRVSQAVYMESIPIFNRNTFHLEDRVDRPSLPKDISPKFCDNVQNIHISPTGRERADALVFRFLPKLKKLRVLTVVYNTWFYADDRTPVQKKFQDPELLFGEFRSLMGHDIMVELRGLVRINIEFGQSPPDIITEVQRTIYQSFVMGEVTKPGPNIWELKAEESEKKAAAKEERAAEKERKAAEKAKKAAEKVSRNVKKANTTAGRKRKRLSDDE